VRLRCIVAGVVFVASLATVSAAGAAETWVWLGYGHDTQLTNRVPSTSITATSVSRLRRWWTTRLDGAIVASPLSARARVDRRSTQVVYATTEAGSVYAIAAETGAVLWQRAFGSVKTPQCGVYGFSSTGTIDVDRRALYEIGAQGELHALDLLTGAELPGWPLRLTDRPDYEYVWGGLQLVGGRIYVPFASYCDETDPQGVAADGRLVTVDPSLVEQTAMFDAVPGYGNLGGIWGWGGVSAEEDDSVIYTAVGNSRVYSDDCGCFVDDVPYGDSVVALEPDLSRVLASDKPREVPGVGDNDFGAAPLLFQPKGCPPLAAAKNKVGTLFVWDRTRLEDGWYARFELSDARSAFVGAPSYDPVRGTFFVSQAVIDSSGPLYGIVAFQAGPECSLHPVWKTVAGAGNQPAPLVVGDVVFIPGGRLGGFHALSAVNGHALWKATTDAQTISPMIEAAGIVLGGDRDGNLYAFGTGRADGLRPR
jgi:outer membrane protein assembly factor BamB